MNLTDVIDAFAQDLAALDHSWALIGGLAVSARTEPRFTNDIDAAVAVESDEEAELLVRGLVDRGYTVPAAVEQEAAHRLAVARLAPPGEEPAPTLDLSFAHSGIEPEIVEAAETVEFLPGLRIPIATTAHLLALKVLAAAPGRPADEADINQLLRYASAKDVDEALLAMRLITARGYHRERDLPRLFEEYRQRFA